MKIPGNAMIALRIPNNIDMVIIASDEAKSLRMADKVSSLTPQPEKLKGKKLLNNPVRTYVSESNWRGKKAALAKNMNDKPIRSVESNAVEKYKAMKFILSKSL
jgi:hypothetical protein